jgi:hypothetical protein
MKSIRVIILIWLAWAFIVIGFQSWITARLVPQWPDHAQEWTTRETGPRYQKDQPDLLEPFMNEQVAWDSEYYLAIAVGGYDDPTTDLVGPPDNPVTKSYAYFPLYPLLIRVFSLPLGLLGMNPIATATLAGVIVSALGALMGMLALYDLTRDSLGEEGALRAVFYLIIFPTAIFMVQVYTEGLFVGLSFMCLAMLKRENWVAAAIFSVCATLTRAVGVTLVIPMALIWLRRGEWMDLEWRQILLQGIRLRPLARGLLAISPLIAFLIWKFSYLGIAFDYIEANYFGRGFLSLGFAFSDWSDAFRSIFTGSHPQHTAYYITEFIGLAIGIVACIATLKTHPELAWFSLAVVLISWGSGPAQGMHRYVLTAPAVFVALATWGRNPVFDRAWTIISVLWMSALAALFALNLWVA